MKPVNIQDFFWFWFLPPFDHPVTWNPEYSPGSSTGRELGKLWCSHKVLRADEANWFAKPQSILLKKIERENIIKHLNNFCVCMLWIPLSKICSSDFVQTYRRRPRGSQSGRKKISITGGRALGTDSHRTISKRSRECWLLIGLKKCFVLQYYCAQSANSISFCRSCSPDPTDCPCVSKDGTDRRSSKKNWLPPLFLAASPLTPQACPWSTVTHKKNEWRLGYQRSLSGVRLARVTFDKDLTAIGDHTWKFSGTQGNC